MPLTDFTHGVASFGVPVLGSGPVFTTGNVFFVSSTSSNAVDAVGHGKSPNKPFATLDYAIGRCTANNGDHIIVMPNHSETVTGAGGITADVAGITIIGMGEYNQRPRFLMDGAATVTVAVSAADVTFKNLVFASGHADVVRCFNITASGCTLEKIEFADNTTNENWLTPIDASSTTDGNANGLKVLNCRWVSPDAGCLNFIELNADVADLVAVGNFVCVEAGTNSAFLKCATGKDVTTCFIAWNYIVNGMTANDLFIDNDTTANTGIVAHNRCGHHDVTTSHSLIDCDGVRLFDNLSTSIDTASGFVLPAIDADS